MNKLSRVILNKLDLLQDVNLQTQKTNFYFIVKRSLHYYMIMIYSNALPSARYSISGSNLLKADQNNDHAVSVVAFSNILEVSSK